MLTITQDVKGKRYEALIDVLLEHCTHFAFVEDRRLMEIEEERLAYMDVLTEEIRWDLIERTIVSGRRQDCLWIQRIYIRFI